MDITVVPLHEHPEYLEAACLLLNEEWKRSEGARLHSLSASCNDLPTCLIMLQDKKLIGHAKLTKIPSIKSACFIESVVIAKHLRRQGFGRILMTKSEEYCRDCLRLDSVYLSTHDQEAFYTKIGYTHCAPVSIYGGPINASDKLNNNVKNNLTQVKNNASNFVRSSCGQKGDFESDKTKHILEKNSVVGIKIPALSVPPLLPSSQIQGDVKRPTKVFMMKKL